MSSPSVRHDSVREGTNDQTTVERGLSMMGRPLRTVGFWAAVSLPFLHVPLLLTGLDSTADTLAFAGLFALNLLALLLGHGHDPS
jgi:hypothetical protein